MFYNYRPDGLSEKGMSKHTQEPWVLFEVGDRVKHFCPASEKEKTSILTVTLEDGTAFGAVYSEDDARRIVACVNACAGLPTEQLEASPLGGVLNGVAGLIAQRDQLLGERSRVGLAIDAAIRDGVVPDEHPLRSRLEMLANHRLREQELRAEVERVNNQINEMPGMDAFDEIDRLRAECGNWEMALGTVLATIPVKEVIRATGTVGDAVAYFKQLHQQRDKLMAALQDVRGALSSVNSGHQHQITVNDEPAYWQTGEWVRWILDEVLPVVDAAINTTKAE